MKINSGYRQDDSEDRKSNRADWVAQARRQSVKNEESAAAKQRQTEFAPLKEENKFSGILESATTAQKVKQTKDDSGEQRREDGKKDRKNAAPGKDSADGAAVGERVERHGSSSGGQYGGSGGFGGELNQTLHLSENFAARSILHIADLERMISAIRRQTNLDGKREVTIELKRSIMEGLKVKITTGDAAQVQVEFLAANEKVRSQIEEHSEELANILRGRGINLQSLTVNIGSDRPNYEESVENQSAVSEDDNLSSRFEPIENNTFTISK
ncbi:MAG: flagellar hook-length control protein FliK [Acidobacteriota bacterium]|nr:flagellar hook-length control protein FliK [Acidobacteriota bacterium]